MTALTSTPSTASLRNTFKQPETKQFNFYIYLKYNIVWKIIPKAPKSFIIANSINYITNLINRITKSPCLRDVNLLLPSANPPPK